MILPHKYLFDFGQRKEISFFKLVTNKGELSVFCSKEKNIDMSKRGEKKSIAVKGAISLNGYISINRQLTSPTENTRWNVNKTKMFSEK
jgi:hypothetical protein